MNDVENAVKDSLTRQIAEIKKQITQIRSKSLKKDLETRFKADQLKSRMILSTLRAQKHTQDLADLCSDQQAQFTLDFHSLRTQIMQQSKLLQRNYSRIQLYNELISTLGSVIPELLQSKQGFNEEETTERMISNLESEHMLGRRVKEHNENGETINNLQELCRLEYIRREVEQFAQKVSMEIKDHELSRDLGNISEVSKGSADQGYSVSSEWPLNPDISKRSEDSFKGEDEVAEYCKGVEPMSLHSVSSNEGAEFLAPRYKKPYRNQRKTCWQKCLQCFSKPK